MKNPGFRGDGDPGGKVVKESNSTRDFTRTFPRPQVRQRLTGPTWINVTIRRRTICVPVWRWKSAPFSTEAAS
jgi:hypothetical protein